MKKKVKNMVLILGIMLASFLVISQESFAQAAYKCTPCGCSQDSVIVHAPGNCSNCGMKLININNPSEGLNYTNLFSEQACELLDHTENLLILDVRSEGEFSQRTTQIGRFKNAINIPITELEKRIGELEKHKEQPILVYCSVSARSPRVSQILADKGYKIYNLLGGLSAWNLASETALPCKNEFLSKQ